MADVLYVQRRPDPDQVSIERLFDEIRACLSPEVKWHVFVSPFPSKGVVARLRNLRAVRKARGGRIVHITGDVHYLALGLPGARTVLTVHDCAVLHRLRGWRREVIRRLWYEWPVRRAAVTTTISEGSRRDLLSWLPADLHSKIRVVPDCLLGEFAPDPRSFNVEAPVFLQVGTKYNKNLARVVEALRGLPCTLSIVGLLSGAQRAHLEEAGVRYVSHGHVSSGRLVEIYHECDALIFASEIEGFGLPIIEAQAVGRPVITSDRSPMPETAGGAALLVDPEDISSIRAAVRKLITDRALREQLVEQGFENVERFRPATVARQYERIYSEVA